MTQTGGLRVSYQFYPDAQGITEGCQEVYSDGTLAHLDIRDGGVRNAGEFRQLSDGHTLLCPEFREAQADAPAF